MITRLTHRLASRVPFLAPRPPTRVEKFAAMAEQLGIPFDFKKPEFSMMLVERVVKQLADPNTPPLVGEGKYRKVKMTRSQFRGMVDAVSGRMPDGDPRPTDNEHDDEGETERTVSESYDGSAGRKDEGDDDE